MGRRKEGRRAGSCSRVIKIIWIIWLFLFLCVCIHIHLGRCWYAIGEYNEIWRRSPLIVKNTCGSYVCFVQFSQCIRIMVHGMQRFKGIAPSASNVCVCVCECVCVERQKKKKSYCTICTYCMKAIGNAQSSALFWYAIDGFSPHVWIMVWIYWEIGVCLSLELIKQKVLQRTLHTNKKEESLLIIQRKLIFSEYN